MVIRYDKNIEMVQKLSNEPRKNSVSIPLQEKKNP